MIRKKNASSLTKLITALLIIILALSSVFLIGRYGWTLLGFNACESAGIESVEVSKGNVRIVGYCPGLSPRGFLGYHSEEKDGTLFVGFNFSGVFGVFENSDFDISIPVDGDIREVVIKTRNDENRIWPQQDEYN